MRKKYKIQRITEDEQLQLKITGTSKYGEGVYLNEDLPIFISGSIEGEEVIVKKTTRTQNYETADVISVINPSVDRVTPFCKYYGACTGCQLQHIKYEKQLEMKKKKVEEALQKITKLNHICIEDTLPASSTTHYRNHARFTVRYGGKLGFVNKNTRQFIQIDECKIMNEGINNKINDLQNKCAETSQLSIRHSNTSDSFLIQPKLMSKEINVPTGQTHYIETVEEIPFRVASPSFFQVNPNQVSLMANIIKNHLNLNGTEVMIDAYAGVGTFAGILSPYVRKIFAIEESPSAIQDGESSLSHLSNIEFIQGKTETVLPNINEEFDTIIVDPSRKGCDIGAIKSILKMKPQNIIYISCDPDTLARDLQLLLNGFYKITLIQPLDMFPHTHHIETIVILSKQIHSEIILASSSPRREKILELANISFQINKPTNPEYSNELDPEKYVEDISMSKAKEIAKAKRTGIIIGSDTIIYANNKIIEKPGTNEEMRSMLKLLSGNTHNVITGISIIDLDNDRKITNSLTTIVHMNKILGSVLEEYIESGYGFDKSGGYSIQDTKYNLVKSIKGCYLNVAGLPLCLLDELFVQLGYSLYLSNSADNHAVCNSSRYQLTGDI